MLASVFITLAVVAIGFLAFKLGVRYIKTRGKITLFQFGEFTNTREGLKNHPYYPDEPNVVEYRDYKYWVRLYPNPGFNLPKVGYYSQARGRRR